MATNRFWVDPDVSGGAGDGSSEADAYASLNAAEVAEQTDLDAANDIAEFHCTSSGGTADTTAVTFVGWTTSATDFILVNTKAGDEAVKTGWDALRYRLEITDGHSIAIQENYFRATGLQLRIIYSSVTERNNIEIQALDAGNEIQISNCYMRGDSNGASESRNVRVVDAQAVFKMWNCICIDADQRGIWIDDATTAEIYNTIVYNGGNRGMEFDVTTTVKNCAVFNITTDDFLDDAGDSTIDFCMSDDGDGTNAVTISGGDPDNEFVDSVNGDFTLVSGGNAEGGGIDDPGSGLYSTDMDGDAYTSTWSVGVDAKAAGASFDLTATDGGVGTDSVNSFMDALLSSIDGGVGTDSQDNTVDFILTVEDGGSVSDVAASIAEYLLSNTDGGIVTDSMTYAEAQVTDSMFMSFTLKQSTVNLTIKQAGKNIALKKSGADITKLT